MKTLDMEKLPLLHINMTVEEFEAGILKCKVEYNTHKNIWTRLFDSAANFKHALIYLAVNYINRKRNLQ